MKSNFKAITLIALGLFLYTRFTTGTLALYITPRFSWLTLPAALGLILVGLSYRRFIAASPTSEHKDHDHEGAGHLHEHEHRQPDEHDHGPSWVGLLLVALPVVLGLLLPPKPLGASAMSNREIGLASLNASAAPSIGAPLADAGERNIVDWLRAFDSNPDPAAFANQKATVIGFVYRDGRFGPDSFMVSRFLVTHCVADASAIGLLVRWPDSADLSADQWVEVQGAFQPGEFDREPLPILVADAVTPTAIPDHPYLYP
jgi:putative membrane protein